MIIVRTERLLACAAVIAGLVAWLFYLNEGLVLSHYDAKAHLVVARRVIDSLTPGWQQIGAVWLPLPHLIQMLPTQVDLLYRTGAFGSLLSIACLGTTTWASARFILSATGSALGATVATALLVLNPSLLYLHATPMTEPLLITLTFLIVLWLYEWVVATRLAAAPNGAIADVPWKLRWALFAAVWTRYEAWPVVFAALAAAALALRLQGASVPLITARVGRLALWPITAILLFMINSRIVVGEWLVTGGFYEPDPAYQSQLGRSLVAIWWGTHRLGGYVVETTALLTAALVLLWTTARSRPERLVAVALFAAATVPVYAFYSGHPFRIRYMIPIAAACVLFCGLGVGVLASLQQLAARRPLRHVPAAAAAILLVFALIESPPWEKHAPMLEEAQWDVPFSLNRRAVTACLAGGYGGEKVLASMGSLAHYMQELSHAGFAIADFIHEGNGDIWHLALETGPARHAGWMLIEERAEGGDTLAHRVRDDALFAAGMIRVCEGGGVALYRRR